MQYTHVCHTFSSDSIQTDDRTVKPARCFPQEPGAQGLIPVAEMSPIALTQASLYEDKILHCESRRSTKGEGLGLNHALLLFYLAG